MVSPRRDGRVRAIPIIQKLMTSICVYISLQPHWCKQLITCIHYLPVRKNIHYLSSHLPTQGHLDSGSRAGREPRSPFHPFARCRPPLPALLASALCQRPSHARGAASLAPGACRRASPAHCSQQPAFRRERSRARCSEHPLQPEQAFRRERSRACTPAGADTGRRTAAPSPTGLF